MSLVSCHYTVTYTRPMSPMITIMLSLVSCHYDHVTTKFHVTTVSCHYPIQCHYTVLSLV